MKTTARSRINGVHEALTNNDAPSHVVEVELEFFNVCGMPSGLSPFEIQDRRRGRAKAKINSTASRGETEVVLSHRFGVLSIGRSGMRRQ